MNKQELNNFVRKQLQIENLNKKGIKSIYEVAKHTGITASALGNYQKGYSDPTMEKATKVLEFLGYNVSIVID